MVDVPIKTIHAQNRGKKVDLSLVRWAQGIDTHTVSATSVELPNELEPRMFQDLHKNVWYGADSWALRASFLRRMNPESLEMIKGFIR